MLFLLFNIFSILLSSHAENFNVKVDTIPLRTLSEKFVSHTIDTLSVNNQVWNYLNFTKMATLARAIAPSYLRFGGTYSDMQLFNETLNGPQIQQFPQCLSTGVFGGPHGNYCQIFTGYPLADNTQQCVTLASGSGTWTNTDCDKSQCYICQLYV
uniref:C-type lectin domain-containing protein n=1 Tax=Acrobeloides nanus TaxID=290746 RepID=A0A914BYD3_9BILA